MREAARPSAAAALSGWGDRPSNGIGTKPRRPHEPFLRKRVFRKGSWGLPYHPTKEEPRGAPARLGRPPRGGRPPPHARPPETPRPTQGGLVLHRPAMAAGVAPTTGGSSAVRTSAALARPSTGPFGPRWSPPPLAIDQRPRHVGSDRRDTPTLGRGTRVLPPAGSARWCPAATPRRSALDAGGPGTMSARDGPAPSTARVNARVILFSERPVPVHRKVLILARIDRPWKS